MSKSDWIALATLLVGLLNTGGIIKIIYNDLKHLQDIVVRHLEDHAKRDV